jgi:hypothetical protein
METEYGTNLYKTNTLYQRNVLVKVGLDLICIQFQTGFHVPTLQKKVEAKVGTRPGGAWEERRYSSYSYLTSATRWG